ncbi:cupin domain-containing protein [Natrinema salsiterrestre]|uniref:Cupin domain-containing protein n=1 Tax=Natrinema salsiterrestre TaxID=2950540 RepID=A0A9Q4Q2B1_9EURY|nr:cupin domain-containing protein [Natrinema salsiterrestre]MDF9746341.1 cupin domain-containing protein [Natrinema salsiterrestre]
MRSVNKSDVPALSRDDGLVSHILHSRRDAAGTDLTITWVDVEPGARQLRHEHDPEQVYVIVAGEGVMTVGDDERAVEAGDLVHIPANTEHGLENTGDTTLEYVSAATPAFPERDVDEFYDE